MFLSIITRCCRRPIALKKNIESVLVQNCDDWEQLLLVDHTGQHFGDPIEWANKQFERYKDVPRGDYVFALDDDGYLTRHDVIEALKRRASCDADIILVKTETLQLDDRLHVYPEPHIWEIDWEKGKRPKRWAGNGSCVVVKRDVWRRYLDKYHYAPGGDWHFITSLVLNRNLYFARLNMVVAASEGRGCGVIFEKCFPDWFDKIQKRYEMECVRDDAWRITP